MSRFVSTFKKLGELFLPKMHVVGLGRWSSSIPEKKAHSVWFHDMCNYDNCYTDMFNKVSFKPTSPLPPLPPPPPSLPSLENIPIMPDHYALDMPLSINKT